MVTILGHEVAHSIADPAVEGDAVRAGAALLAAPWERLLEVSGPDAADFLHNLLTQHIRGIDVGVSAPAALATRKGHIVADLTVFRADADCFRLRVASPFAAGVLEVFEKHRIMEDVVFRWSHADPGAFLVVGPRSGDVIASVAADLPALGALAIPVRELTSSDTLLGFDSLHRERIRDLCVRRGAVSVGWQAFDRRRVEVGRAWFGIDADGERLVPEPGFEDRIHYNKGCYLGQEPLARLHFRGRPNWALVRLEGGLSPGLAPGADLLDEGGARVGWITSVAPGTDDVVALGYLHRRFRETAVATVSAEGGHSLGWTED